MFVERKNIGVDDQTDIYKYDLRIIDGDLVIFDDGEVISVMKANEQGKFVLTVKVTERYFTAYEFSGTELEVE
jgi:hypothetical protein